MTPAATFQASPHGTSVVLLTMTRMLSEFDSNMEVSTFTAGNEKWIKETYLSQECLLHRSLKMMVNY